MLMSILFSSAYPTGVPKRCIPITDLRHKGEMPTWGTQGEPFEEHFIHAFQSPLEFNRDRNLLNGKMNVLPTTPPVVNILTLEPMRCRITITAIACFKI